MTIPVATAQTERASKRTPSRRALWGIGWAVLVGAAVAAAIALRPFRPSLPVLVELPPFSLVDQEERRVGLPELQGVVWVADFVFTSCATSCPRLTARMKLLQSFLLQERSKRRGHLAARLVSFTVDPEVDTPARLHEYAQKWGAERELWIFLTGSLAEIDRAVTQGMKIPFEKGGADTSAFDVMHGENFVIVDQHARIRGYFQADDQGMADLEKGILALLEEP